MLAAAGTYGRLVDYKVLGDWVFLSLCGVALIRLRRKLPDAARPIPVPFYPFTPLALSVAGGLMVANALVTNPWHTTQGFAVIALGIPAFFIWWRAPALA
jgi:amino acid transporter